MRLPHDPHSLPPEEVVPFRDAETGASGVIVLHSTALGPAAGGCRLWRYARGPDAAGDALRPRYKRLPMPLHESLIPSAHALSAPARQ